jgi:hypothetical protein
MKLYATVKVPTRVSYEEMKDISYTREFDSTSTFDEVIKWARKVMMEKADEGPGTLREGPEDEVVFHSIKLSIFG